MVGNRGTSGAAWAACILILLMTAAACAPTPTAPSRSAHEYRIALVQFGTHPVINAVRRGIEERIDELFGKAVTITPYNANFDQSALQQAALQAIAGRYDLIVPITTPASQAVINSSDGNTPIVFTFVTEPAALGYSGPGSLVNVTGVSDAVPYDMTLGTIRDLVGRHAKVGYLVTSSEANAAKIFKEFSQRAAKYDVELVAAEIKTAADVPQAAATLASRVDAFLVGGDHTVVSAVDALLTVAGTYQKPVFACDVESIEKGAVAGATVNYPDLGRRTAEIIAFVLAGASAQRLPVEVVADFKGYYNATALSRYALKATPGLLENFGKVGGTP